MGIYANSFGQELVISDAAWGAYRILDVNNTANRMVFEATIDSVTSFGRIVWTEPSQRGTIDYCFEVISTPDVELARNSTSRADASNPAVSGCGNAPWARAWLAVDIWGEYAVDGATHTVTATVWQRPEGTLTLSAWGNAEARVIATSPGNALPYRIVEWTPGPAEGEWWFCDVLDGFTDAREAFSSTVTADASAPTTDGCSGGPWSLLEPR